MKKNKMMRLASGLLVATLLTTSMISGTFAKYVTSASGNDSARVAKWGIEVAVEGKDVFGNSYKDKANDTGDTVVSAVTVEDVIAPGTNGDLGSVTISGKPEVKVKVTSTVDVELQGWEESYNFDINGDGENETGTTKCPLVITVNDVEYQIDGNNTDADELELAVEKAIQEAIQGTGVEILNNIATKTYNANNDFGLTTTKDVTVTWAWAFGTADAPATLEDINDTALGNLGVAPTISLTTNVVVEQID